MSRRTRLATSTQNAYTSTDDLRRRLAERREAVESAKTQTQEALKALPTKALLEEVGKNALPQDKTQAIIQGVGISLFAGYCAATATGSAIGALVKGIAQGAAIVGAVNLAKNDQGEIRELLSRGFAKAKELNPLDKKDDGGEDDEKLTSEEREELLEKLLREAIKRGRVVDIDDDSNVKE